MESQLHVADNLMAEKQEIFRALDVVHAGMARRLCQRNALNNLSLTAPSAPGPGRSQLSRWVDYADWPKIKVVRN